MVNETAARPFPQVTFRDKFETYGMMTVKGFVLFLILGFISSPLWRSVYDTSRFWNYILIGMAIFFGLIIALLLLGVVTATFGKIFSIFKPKKKITV